MPRPYAAVLITAPDRKSADRLATVLLRRRLAACVNRLDGVRSRYWWKGKLESAREILLIVKTRAALLRELAACVKENHPYTVPEVIALPIEGGHEPYLDWLGESTRPPRR